MNKADLISQWQALPWNRIKLKANHYLPRIALVVLLLLIAQTFADLTWETLTPVNNPVENQSNTPARTTKVTSAKSALSDVAAFHLFGDATKQPVAVQKKVIDAPETRLRLELKGVFASSISEQAMAIISSSKGKEKAYHLGDKITAGAILHAVYSDRVILKRNGQLETLRLPKTKLDNNAISQAPVAQAKRNTTRPATPPLTPRERGHYRGLKEIREDLLKDPAKVWQQVRINPVMKNGEVHGYTMAHNDTKLMQSLNLRDTDVITSVNGQALSDPATLYGLMGNLSNEQVLELEIERDGQPQTIRLTF